MKRQRERAKNGEKECRRKLKSTRVLAILSPVTMEGDQAENRFSNGFSPNEMQQLMPPASGVNALILLLLLLLLSSRRDDSFTHLSGVRPHNILYVDAA